VGNTISADTADVTNVEANQLGTTASPPNAEISDLTVNGAVDGIQGLTVVQSEADLPAVDPPQIAFVKNINRYRKAVNTEGFILNRATFQKSISTDGGVPRGIEFSTDGTKMFEVDQNGAATRGEIIEYDLTDSFDISTATVVDRQSVANSSSDPQAVRFNSDGTKIFISDDTSGQAGIKEFNLSTPFDLSSGNLTGSFDFFDTQDNSPLGFDFADNGAKMYVAGANSDLIREYTLSTGFDVTTASFVQSISPQPNTPTGLAISNDGRKIFETGSVNDLIFSSELTTNFDLSTASLLRSIPTQDTSTQDIAFSDDGTELFEISRGSNLISQSTSGFDSEFQPITQNND
jgi:DNA-binding beta-propeller fold protein YncE